MMHRRNSHLPEKQHDRKWERKMVLFAAFGAGILLLLASPGGTVLTVRAESASISAISGVSAAAKTGSSTTEFIPSTPEMQKKQLTLAGEKEKCREALDALYDAGVSPMAIAEKLFGDKAAAAAAGTSAAAAQEETPTKTTGADTASWPEDTGTGTAATSNGNSLGDAAIAAAQQTGDKLVDGASKEVEKTKRSLLDTLKENIKEAASDLVDALFAKL